MFGKKKQNISIIKYIIFLLFYFYYNFLKFIFNKLNNLFYLSFKTISKNFKKKSHEHILFYIF